MNRLGELSIIIVTWKGDDLLRGCLDSLARAVGIAPEIVVVDNAAEESTQKLVAAYSNTKYVASPGNPGFAGGNNIGLKHTTRDYILLLNNDTVIHTDSFSPLIDFLDAHPKVGVVQGTMNVPAKGNVLDVCGEDVMPWGLLRHRLIGKPTASTPLRAKRVSAAKGALLCLKRQVVAAIGGRLFDPSFKNYFEDIDLCLRARNAGWETWFVPTPPIDHLCGQTTAKLNGDEVWVQYFRNIFYSFWKNFGFFGRFFTLPCFAFAVLIRFPRHFFKALVLLARQP